MTVTKGYLTIERILDGTKAPPTYLYSLVNSAQIPPETCAITSPAAGASLIQGAPVTITGTILNPGTVVVKLGSTTLGSAVMSGLNWSYSWTPQVGDVGAQTLNAVATETDDGSTANAPGIAITVTPALAIAITSPAPSANVMLNAQTPSTGVISKPGTNATVITGTITQAGTVVVKLGGVTLGSATMAGLNWSYSWTPAIAQYGAGQTLNATVTATVGGATANAPGVSINVALIGQVGSRTYIPGLASASLAYNFRQIEHNRSGQSLAGVGIAVVNAYISSTGVKTTTGGSITYNATVEYPLGTVVGVVTWNAATSVSVAALASQFSDVLPVPGGIPADATFAVNVRLVPSGGALAPYTNGWSGHNTSLGDGIVQSASDLTGTPASITGNALGATAMFRCAAIFGVQSTRKPIYLSGDSKQGAQIDATLDSTGNEGELPRAFGQIRPILNVARGATQRQHFATDSSLQAPFANLCLTHIDAFFVNDFASGSRTSTQFLADGVTCRTAIGLPYTQVAGVFTSSGAWTAVDGSDQTINAPKNTQCVAAKTAMRAGISGDLGFLEIAAQLEMTLDSGKWKADGTVGKYTTDGLHETTFANLSLVLTPP